ncbi:hypothetical protein HYS48_05040 [Candidatus Woesearchaeota archaeon]|nr:hypothetical protein [Candidatus Woesearchaeota archaeon]
MRGYSIGLATLTLAAASLLSMPARADSGQYMPEPVVTAIATSQTTAQGKHHDPQQLAEQLVRREYPYVNHNCNQDIPCPLRVSINEPASQSLEQRTEKSLSIVDISEGGTIVRKDGTISFSIIPHPGYWRVAVDRETGETYRLAGFEKDDFRRIAAPYGIPATRDNAVMIAETFLCTDRFIHPSDFFLLKGADDLIDTLGQFREAGYYTRTLDDAVMDIKQHRRKFDHLLAPVVVPAKDHRGGWNVGVGVLIPDICSVKEDYYIQRIVIRVLPTGEAYSLQQQTRHVFP